MTNRPRTPLASQRKQIHLSDYLRVLYRRRWIAALVLLVSFVYGAFGTLKKRPMYEASTQLVVDKGARRATTLDSVVNSGYSYLEDEDFYETQLRIMRSRAVAARAAAKLGLKVAELPETEPVVEKGIRTTVREWVENLVGAPKAIAPPPVNESTAESAMINGLLGGLRLSRQPRTSIVNISYVSADPLFAARAANQIAEEYIAETLQTRIDDTNATQSYLVEQVNEYKNKVATSERAVQEYQERNGAVVIDNRQSMAASPDQMDLNARLTSARVARIEKEALYRNVLALQKNDPAKLESLPAVMGSEFVSSLKKDLLQFRQDRANLMSRYTEKAPQVVALDGKIKEAEDRLKNEIGKVVQSIEGDYETALSTETSMQSAVGAANANTTRLSKKNADYIALKEDADSNRSIYNSLLDRMKQTGVANEYRGTNTRIVDRAEVPRAPFSPNTRHDLMIAFLWGCVYAVAVAFGLEYLDSRIRTPEEIKSHLGIPFLGLVPAVDEKQLGGVSPLISNAVPPAFAEAIRAVRTAVVFSSADEGARTVVVTSTAPGEGKTLISTNLSVALAQAEQRTLIIDGDMRRPRVHEVFERLPEPGLSNVLVGTSELHAAICRTAVPNLFVLPAGHIPPNPAELLGSAKYRELIEDLRHQFDWIIVDAPPVMAVTDAAIVASGATGVVFVVGSEMTSRRHASFAIDQLTAVKAHFIGAVLNRADVQRHGYYYSTYYRKDYTQAYTRSS